MRLGLVGFSADRQTYLGKLLASRFVAMRWQPWPFADADAWWVNGTHAVRQANGNLRIPPGEPTGRAIQFDLAHVNRPVAFAVPMAVAGVDAPTFDPSSTESVLPVLKVFESLLQARAVQLTLASMIAARVGQLRSSVYHLTLQGNLLAVIDLHGRVTHSPNVQPSDLEKADWSGKPEIARLSPPHFIRTSIAAMMWQYALRTQQDWLPPRYRSKKLFFRQAPRVQLSLLEDKHLALVRELAGAPGDFRQLQQRTGLSEEQMARALTALYFVGAITSKREQAAPPQTLKMWQGGSDDEAAGSDSLAPSLLEGEPLPYPRPGFNDGTMPAPLNFQD